MTRGTSHTCPHCGTANSLPDGEDPRGYICENCKGSLASCPTIELTCSNCDAVWSAEYPGLTECPNCQTGVELDEDGNATELEDEIGDNSEPSESTSNIPIPNILEFPPLLDAANES